MDWKLELVVVPVTDVDRAKEFYVEQAGFDLDVDHAAGETFRVVQMTPPGSACSIAIGIGVTDGEPGSVRGVHLVVADIEAARAELVGARRRGRRDPPLRARAAMPGPDPERQRLRLVRHFDDPDGNTWVCRRSAAGKPEPAVTAAPSPTRRPSPRSPSATGASCTSTATGCWPRSTRPRTPCRRRSCGRGAAGTASTAARCSGPGSTASPRTSASTCSGARSRRRRGLRSFAEVPWLQPYPDRLLDEVAADDDEPDARRGRRGRRSSWRSSPPCRCCRRASARR